LTDAVFKRKNAKQGLASSLLEQIKISSYTEYKAFGPLQIYKIIDTVFSAKMAFFNKK